MLLAPKPAKEDKIDNIEQKLLHISGVPRLLAHPVYCSGECKQNNQE